MCCDSLHAKCLTQSRLETVFITFDGVCNHVTDFNVRNKCLTTKLLEQGFRYHKLRKKFLDSTEDTMNLMLGLRRFYVRAFRNQNFMVTRFINSSQKLIGRIIFFSLVKPLFMYVTNVQDVTLM